MTFMPLLRALRRVKGQLGQKRLLCFVAVESDV
jgi:hypothetical protein